MLSKKPDSNIIHLYKLLSTEMIKVKSSPVYCEKLYFLESGSVFVHYDGAVLSKLSAPQFIGLFGIYNSEYNMVKIEFSENEVSLFSINYSEARKIIDSNHAHDVTAEIISSKLCSLVRYLQKIKTKKAYEKIIEGIAVYTGHEQCLGVQQISLSKFLIDFTGLSKSRVMRIVQELRAAGIIQNGSECEIIFNSHLLPK